jgi:hypothetical protein
VPTPAHVPDALDTDIAKDDEAAVDGGQTATVISTAKIRSKVKKKKLKSSSQVKYSA